MNRRMGVWKWVNGALLVAVVYYGAADVAGHSWFDYNPRYTSGTMLADAPCPVRLERGSLHGQAMLRLRFAQGACRGSLRAAWLEAGTARVDFTGHLHAYAAEVPSGTALNRVALLFDTGKLVVWNADNKEHHE